MLAISADNGHYILSDTPLKRSYTLDDLVSRYDNVILKGRVSGCIDDALLKHYQHHRYLLISKDGITKTIKLPSKFRKYQRWSGKKKKKMLDRFILDQLKATTTQKVMRKAATFLKKWSRKDIVKVLDDRYYSRYPRELIIGTKDRASLQEVASSISHVVGGRYSVFRNIPYAAITGVDTQRFKARKVIENRLKKYITSIQKSGTFHTPELLISDAALDYSTLLQWNLQNIGLPTAWNISKGNRSTVMVIDTGIDFSHPDLRDRIRKGWSFDGAKPIDRNGHGTHVAGIVGGSSTGVAPAANLYPAKALDDEGSGSNTSVIYAIDQAISDSTIDVINMSLGSPGDSYALRRVCKAAYEKGILLLAAAGNSGFGAEYPAAYPTVVSVAAVDPDNKHARFSNIHKTVEISAPGVGIYSTYPGGNYERLTGTSMATPHCAGVAALAMSCNNNYSNVDVRKRLLSSAMTIGAGETKQKEKYGAGLVRADLLLESMRHGFLRRLWK